MNEIENIYQTLLSQTFNKLKSSLKICDENQFSEIVNLEIERIKNGIWKYQNKTEQVPFLVNWYLSNYRWTISLICGYFLISELDYDYDIKNEDNWRMIFTYRNMEEILIFQLCIIYFSETNTFEIEDPDGNITELETISVEILNEYFENFLFAIKNHLIDTYNYYKNYETNK